MTNYEVLIQQLITGFSNGLIIALIALGYSLVYGVLDLINFAHGDLFMLGAFMSLTLLGLLAPILGVQGVELGANLLIPTILLFILMVLCTATFCGLLNFCVERYVYRPLRNSPKLAPLVAALGVSFIFINIGLLWGGLPLEVFNNGNAAASPKDFPDLVSNQNILELFLSDPQVILGYKDLIVFFVTISLLFSLRYFIKFTSFGRAVRAVAQDKVASKLMGINLDKTISLTFVLSGILAGVASIIYAMYNNTISFQMGFRAGIDSFSAAVLGGIGNIPGAVLGGIIIGLIRSLSDQYISSQWTNATVFSVLILVLMFRPTGLLGSSQKEKV